MLLKENQSLLDELANTTTLDAAFRKLETHKFHLATMEAIAQDEFSHDIVIPFPNQSNYLVIAVT